VSADSDVARYRELLRGVEREAKGQPWADERPWQGKTHVVAEMGVAVVDLHDLGAALARTAVRAVIDADAEPAAGAVVFVHGRGKHSVGVHVLRSVAHKELQKACATQRRWRYRTVGNARVAWITDRKRAPDWVTGGWNPWVWVVGGALLLAAAAGIAHAIGVL